MAAGRDSRSRLPVDPDVPSGDQHASAPHPRPRLRGPRLVVVAAVGVGGAVGALGRYALSLAVPAAPGRFPWGTFTINLSGSAGLGFLLALVNEGFPRGRLARSLLGTGVVGAYTTFSTFVVEAVLLVRAGAADDAVAYVLGSLVAGLLAALSGMTAGRLAVRTERWLQQEAR